MATVLFNSARKLGRCENITAVWDAYHGDKVFLGGAKGLGGFVDVSECTPDVIVTDEFVKRKRPGQTVVMIAHGLTGGKLYGNDQRDGIFIRQPGGPELTDWYVVSSEYGRRFASTAAGIPVERCIPLGMPRTDAYFGARRGDGGIEWAQGRTVYLYVPTFRSRYDAPFQPPSFKRISRLLEDDEVFIFKRHMNSHANYIQTKLEHVVEVPSAAASIPYLTDCDVVATDFSSIMFDAHVLGKPVVLTADGDDPYLTSRGMYMRYPDEYASRWIAAPGNEEAFVDMLREAHANGPRNADIMCRVKTASACDGRSAERVVGLVEAILRGRGEEFAGKVSTI